LAELIDQKLLSVLWAWEIELVAGKVVVVVIVGGGRSWLWRKVDLNGKKDLNRKMEVH